MKVVAVIPAWNEAARLRAVLLCLRANVSEMVVVDDGSHDETATIAEAAGARVVRHALNRGQGAALKTGTLAALQLEPDVIVHLDADGQHDPVMLATLLEPLVAGQADIVYGSRFLGIEAEGMPSSRRLLLRLARTFSTYVLGLPHTMTDPQSGLRAMRREVAEELTFTQDGMAHCSEMLRLITRSRFRWQEVAVPVLYTKASLQKGQKASHAFKIVWELLLGSF